MTDLVSQAYTMAQQGYGWEDIHANYPGLTQRFCWSIVQSVDERRQAERAKLEALPKAHRGSA